MISVVTPAFNEEASLPALHARLAPAMAQLEVEWEWIIVDDHSRDDTFAVVERLARMDPRVSGIRLARNAGSHVAVTCALHHASGDAAVLMVADLQDPPEVIAAMCEEWRRGAQVVWGVRRRHPGQRSDAGTSSLYYWIMRGVVGLKELPEGTDFFLIDRVVIDAFRRFEERNVSVFALIAWSGFRQAQVQYNKAARVFGRSGWTLSRKVKLLIDSVTAFSDLPIKACTVLGGVLTVVGLLVSVAGAAQWFRTGAGLLLILGVMVAVGGLQLVAVGMVGEYVWRAFDQARRRPAFLIERTVGALAAPPVLR